MEQLSTPAGAVEFLTTVAMRNPSVAAQAFGELASGKQAEDFLVEIGLSNPDLLEAAYDRATRLIDNEGERKAHERERDTRQRETAIEARERRIEETHQRERARAIASETIELVEAADLDEVDAEEVEERIRERVRENRTQHGRADISSAEIKEIVGTVQKRAELRAAKVRERFEQEQRAKKREKVREMAKQPRRPAPPRASSPAPRRKGMNVPAGMDPLDAAVDYAVSRQG